MDLNSLYKSADGSALRFYTQAAKNTFQSERHGRPIYDQVLFVEVIAPGSRESSPVFELERMFADEAGVAEPLRSPQFDKFREQIRAYKGDTESGDMRGTPLSAWPAIDAPTAASLAEGRVYTVEALAQLPDEKLRVLGPQGRTLRERAQVFLNAAAGNAQVEGMAADMQNLREENDQLRADLAAANAEVERLRADIAAGPGAQAGAIQGANQDGANGSGGGKPAQRRQGKAADAEKGNGASGEGRETGNDTARAPNSQQQPGTDPATAGAVNTAQAPVQAPASAPAPAGTTQTSANPQGGNALPPII